MSSTSGASAAKSTASNRRAVASTGVGARAASKPTGASTATSDRATGVAPGPSAAAQPILSSALQFPSASPIAASARGGRSTPPNLNVNTRPVSSGSSTPVMVAAKPPNVASRPPATNAMFDAMLEGSTANSDLHAAVLGSVLTPAISALRTSMALAASNQSILKGVTQPPVNSASPPVLLRPPSQQGMKPFVPSAFINQAALIRPPSLLAATSGQNGMTAQVPYMLLQRQGSQSTPARVPAVQPAAVNMPNNLISASSSSMLTNPAIVSPSPTAGSKSANARQNATAAATRASAPKPTGAASHMSADATMPIATPPIIAPADRAEAAVKSAKPPRSRVPVPTRTTGADASPARAAASPANIPPAPTETSVASSTGSSSTSSTTRNTSKSKRGTPVAADDATTAAAATTTATTPAAEPTVAVPKARTTRTGAAGARGGGVTSTSAPTPTSATPIPTVSASGTAAKSTESASHPAKPSRTSTRTSAQTSGKPSAQTSTQDLAQTSASNQGATQNDTGDAAQVPTPPRTAKSRTRSQAAQPQAMPLPEGPEAASAAAEAAAVASAAGTKFSVALPLTLVQGETPKPTRRSGGNTSLVAQEVKAPTPTTADTSSESKVASRRRTRTTLSNSEPATVSNEAETTEVSAKQPAALETVAEPATVASVVSVPPTPAPQVKSTAKTLPIPKPVPPPALSRAVIDTAEASAQKSVPEPLARPRGRPPKMRVDPTGNVAAVRKSTRSTSAASSTGMTTSATSLASVAGVLSSSQTDGTSTSVLDLRTPSSLTAGNDSSVGDITRLFAASLNESFGLAGSAAASGVMSIDALGLGQGVAGADVSGHGSVGGGMLGDSTKSPHLRKSLSLREIVLDNKSGIETETTQRLKKERFEKMIAKRRSSIRPEPSTPDQSQASSDADTPASAESTPAVQSVSPASTAPKPLSLKGLMGDNDDDDQPTDLDDVLGVKRELAGRSPIAEMDTKKIKMATDTSASKFTGPKVLISEGKMVLDEESLLVAHPDPELTPALPDQHVTSSTWSKFTVTPKWTMDEVRLFYRLIGKFGTDFALISQYFPHRTRAQIKRRYLKEDREHPRVVDLALRNRLDVDVEDFIEKAERYKLENKEEIELRRKMEAHAKEAEHLEEGNARIAAQLNEQAATPVVPSKVMSKSSSFDAFAGLEPDDDVMNILAKGGLDAMSASEAISSSSSSSSSSSALRSDIIMTNLDDSNNMESSDLASLLTGTPKKPRSRTNSKLSQVTTQVVGEISQAPETADVLEGAPRRSRRRK